MRKITGLAETVFDILFKDGQPRAAVPGGSTFNSIISLGRTAVRDFPGTKVRMLACTGDDYVGNIVSSFMAEMLRRADDAGAFVYYDINYRRNHIRRLPELLENIRQNCRASSVVRGSIEDFEIVFDVSDPVEAYERYMKDLCPTLICTCGSEPVHLFTGKEHFIYPVAPVDTVSTIGAGDNFNAGFIYGLFALGINKGCLSSLNKEDWDKLISTASSFSAAACRSVWNYVDKDFRP